MVDDNDNDTNIHDRHEDERRIMEFLMDAGIHASEIDPLSLGALCDHLLSHDNHPSSRHDNNSSTPSPLFSTVPKSSLLSSTTTKGGGKNDDDDAEDEKEEDSPREEKQGGSVILDTTTATSTLAARSTSFRDDDRQTKIRSVTFASNNKTPAGGTLSPPLTIEERIFRRLDDQTKLILNLQQRVEELTRTVVDMSKSGTNTNGGGGDVGVWRQRQGRGLQQPVISRHYQVARGAPPPRPSAVPVQRMTGIASVPPHVNNDVPPLPPQPPQQPPPAAPHNNLVVLPLLGSMVQRVMDLPQRVRNSRTAKIIKLYLELRRRQVPDLDLAMMVKVLIMMAILMARLTRHTPAAAPHQPPPRFSITDSSSLVPFLMYLWKWYRLHIAAAFIITGFLLQSGYARFLYNFVVKEDYPGRIWNGEDIDVEQIMQQHQQRQQPQPPRPRQQQQPQPPAAGRPPAQPPAPDADGAVEPAATPAQNPAVAVPAARPPQVPAAAAAAAEYFVAGHVRRRDDPAQPPRPAPIRIVIEVGYLISSFVLSIFPMWQPVAVEPQAVPATAPPAGPTRENSHPEDNDDDDEEEEDYDEHDDDESESNSRLSRVRPPQDPAEYEDESDDE